MSKIGILAYGSLINDPGAEISKLISEEIQVMTPFPVEFVRISKTRGAAPTVAPYKSGRPVKAKLFVLKDSVLLQDAKSLLWRRETRKEGLDRDYRESTGLNAVIIRDRPGFHGLDHALYTDFNPSGKINDPDPGELAKAAIDSVAKAPDGKDGITYLMDIISIGIETQLTLAYQKEILAQTGTLSLAEALTLARSRGKEPRD